MKCSRRQFLVYAGAGLVGSLLTRLWWTKFLKNSEGVSPLVESWALTAGTHLSLDEKSLPISPSVELANAFVHKSIPLNHEAHGFIQKTKDKRIVALPKEFALASRLNWIEGFNGVEVTEFSSIEGHLFYGHGTSSGENFWTVEIKNYKSTLVCRNWSSLNVVTQYSFDEAGHDLVKIGNNLYYCVGSPDDSSLSKILVIEETSGKLLNTIYSLDKNIVLRHLHLTHSQDLFVLTHHKNQLDKPILLSPFLVSRETHQIRGFEIDNNLARPQAFVGQLLSCYIDEAKNIAWTTCPNGGAVHAWNLSTFKHTSTFLGESPSSISRDANGMIASFSSKQNTPPLLLSGLGKNAIPDTFMPKGSHSLELSL